MLISGNRQVLTADTVRLCGWEVRYIAETRFTSRYRCIHTHLVKPVPTPRPPSYIKMLISPEEVSI